jgi:hypothetical protein
MLGGICMEKHNQVNTALWIALLFIIITSAFSLPNRLSVLILRNGEPLLFVLYLNETKYKKFLIIYGKNLN